MRTGRSELKKQSKSHKQFIWCILADVLKGKNKYLEKCIMTDIVRIAGAEIFL